MRVFILFLLSLWTSLVNAADLILTPEQTIEASGTREITPFSINGQRYLAIAQLAKDIPDTKANMNGGNSDVDVIILKEKDARYLPYQRIPSHGNEGSAFFSIDGNHFLAVASIRSGPEAPYNMQTYSKLYRWDGKKFYPVQQFFALATKQWKHFQIGTRHFLAQANGVTTTESSSNSPTDSIIYEWDGTQFKHFQTIPSTWAYSWEFFTLEGKHYLALADHIKQSVLYRWNGKEFVAHQVFAEAGGRAFKYFRINNQPMLAFAVISNDSKLYQYQNGQWQLKQILEGTGGRNFTFFSRNNQNYLLRINFIQGTREQPITALKSPLYRWEKDKFVVAQELDTFGGVSAELFTQGKNRFIAVANSLSKDIRFKVKSVIYKIL